MEKTFGYFIFGGLLIGAMFGLIWAGGRNPVMGIGIGAMIGAALGWFIAAAVLEQRKKEK
ncbi:MAG TPA: hypothetical protein VFY66_07605 [Anaerolineales bacterium]|nr:hypothetical protein [Anaerolineales bacterium]